MATSAAAQTFTPAGRVTIPGESTQTRDRLAAIDRLCDELSARAAAGVICRLTVARTPFAAMIALAPALADRPFDAWEQIEEAYYFRMTDSGEALAAWPGSTGPFSTAQTLTQVRRLCHMRLAALPPSVRALYRERVDDEARRLLTLGEKNRDPAPLRQLVDERFCSTHGAAALALLGDLAFERGDFDEARHWWRLLAPLPPVAEHSLRCPTAGVDVPQIEAKQILALAFQGAVTQAGEELDRFHHRFPRAHGSLAGKTGLFSETVHFAIQGVIKAGLANSSEPWPTFGGDYSRNHVLSVCPPTRLWEDGPTWKVPLPPLDGHRKPRGDDRPERGSFERRLAFHPVIVGQQVLIAGCNSVTSFHLATGKRLFHYDLKSAGLLNANGSDRRPTMPSYTLSVDGNRCYARLGQQGFTPFKVGDTDQASYLVCLDLAAPGDADRPRELWHVRSLPDEFFEGAPVVRGGLAYVALSRSVGLRVVTALQCYDAQGRVRWSRDVCDCPEFDASTTPRNRHHLLTWAGGQLVYCSHAGAIVSVDPWTGQTLWAVRYACHPQPATEDAPPPRDVAPCVADEARIFVAPLDSDRLYCLETTTGRVLWERDGLDVVHVIGAAHGRVFFTTRNGVHAVSADTGMTVWQQPSEGRLAGLGRGLLAGGWLLWPTHDVKLPLRALTLADGRQQKGDEESPFAEPRAFDPTQLRLIPAGNMAFGHGCLVVAGPDELVAFVPTEPLTPLPAGPDTRPHASLGRGAAGLQNAARVGDSGTAGH